MARTICSSLISGVGATMGVIVGTGVVRAGGCSGCCFVADRASFWAARAVAALVALALLAAPVALLALALAAPALLALLTVLVALGFPVSRIRWSVQASPFIFIRLNWAGNKQHLKT